MTEQQARAVWKAILRNHPFFRYAGYQPWGFDWATFNACYPRSAKILREAIRTATLTEG